MFPPTGREGYTLAPVSAYNGIEAYQDALSAGYNGTVEEWLILAPQLSALIYFAPMGLTPIGMFVADSSAVSRKLYNKLFAVIGTTFGDGDGHSTYNLPDFRFLTRPIVNVNTSPDGIARGILLDPNTTEHVIPKAIESKPLLNFNVLIRY